MYYNLAEGKIEHNRTHHSLRSLKISIFWVLWHTSPHYIPSVLQSNSLAYARSSPFRPLYISYRINLIPFHKTSTPIPSLSFAHIPLQLYSISISTQSSAYAPPTPAFTPQHTCHYYSSIKL